MFYAAATFADDRSRRILAAAELHAGHLAETGFFTRLESRSFEGAALFWDGGSSHASIFDRSDGAALLRGGYLAAPDEWKGNVHSTEAPDAWGEFAAVKVSMAADGVSLRVFSDPAASWPIYFGAHDGAAVASNDPHFVAVALGFTGLSAVGAYEVLTYSHAVGTGTTIDGVSRAFPGEQVTLRRSRAGGSLTVDGRSTLSYSRERTDPATTYAALRDSIAGAAEIARRFPSSTVQISGGLDSRLTAGVLAEVFPERPASVTLDLSDRAELDVAAEVSQRLGFPHRQVSLEQISAHAMRKGWLLTGGQVSVYAAAGNVLSYETANDGDQVTIIGGWPGDCLIGSYIPLLPTMTVPALTAPVVRDWARKRGYKWSEIGVRVSGRRAGAIARRARSNLRRRLLDSSGRTAAQKISHWAMFSRQPAFSYVSPALLSSHVLAITPLLARPYLVELLKLTGDEIMGKNFYRRMLLEALPQLADIPYSTTGEPITKEVVRPRWKPTTRGELYQLFPDLLQWLTRRLRPQGPYNPANAETEFWSAMFDREGAEGVVELDGLTIDARAVNHLHVRSVSLALRWTRDYLGAAADELRHTT